MRYFEDAVVGKTFVQPDTHTLTEEEIIQTGRLWDPRPFHIDKAAAAQSIYGGLVACTAHLFGTMTKLAYASEEAAWAGVAALKSTDMINHAPVYAGDTLFSQMTCIARGKSRSKPGLGIIEFKTTLINQRAEPVFSVVNIGLYPMQQRINHHAQHVENH